MYLFFMYQSTILFYEVILNVKLAICKNKKKLPKKKKKIFYHKFHI